MTIFIFSSLAWLAIVAFAVLRDKLPALENIVLFFGIFIIQRSLFTLLSLNLKRIVMNDNLEFYVAGLINRSVTFPMLLLLFVNLFCQRKRPAVRWGAAIMILAALNAILWLAETCKIIEYRDWNSFDSFLFVLFIMVGSFVLERGYRIFVK